MELFEQQVINDNKEIYAKILKILSPGKILLAISIMLFCACTNHNTTSYSETPESKKRITEMADSMVKKSERDAIFDTIGVSTADIKVLKSRFVQEEYSNYKSIEVTFKNIGTRPIDGIRFSWYGENVFGDPADMGNSTLEGYGGGFTDKKIRPGQTQSLQWNILSKDGKKIVAVWPREIVYEDGSKWQVSK